MHLQPLRSGGQRSVPPSAARSRCRAVSARCCGLPSPPAPLPQRGRGVIVVLASLTDASAESPYSARLTPSSPAARERKGAGGKVRAAIVPIIIPILIAVSSSPHPLVRAFQRSFLTHQW